MADQPSRRSEPARRRRGRPPHPDILTPREWQVLDLLRQDLTNEQIAQRLDISYATAKYHVAEIISKLGVQTREQAAAWQPEAVAVRWWQRATAWLPRRAWPVAGAAGVLAALVGLGVLAWGVLWDSEEETSPVAVASPTATAATPAPTGGSPAQTAGPTSPSVTIAPNGEQLSYIGRKGEIRLVNADGSNDHVFNDTACEPATSGMDFSAAWSPDGAYLAFYCPSQTNLTRLLVILDSEGEEVTGIENATDFSWSPISTRLAYQTVEYAVRLLDVGTGQTVDVYNNALLLEWVGPDVLLFGLDPVPGEMTTQFKAHLFEITSGQIGALPRFDNPGSFWISPDGSRAILLTDQWGDGGRGMILYNFATEQETPLQGGFIGYPSQGVPRHQLAFSGDGTTIYWADATSTVWLAALDAPKAVRVGQVHALFVAVSPSGLTASFEELPGGGSGNIVVDDARSSGHADLGTGSLTYAWRPAR